MPRKALENCLPQLEMCCRLDPALCKDIKTRHFRTTQSLTRRERATKLGVSKCLSQQRPSGNMVRPAINAGLREVRRLERRRRYEMHCAIRRRDERSWGLREDEFPTKLIAKYKLLYGIQDAMKVRCTTSIVKKNCCKPKKEDLWQGL